MRRSNERGERHGDFDGHHLVMTKVHIYSNGFAGRSTRKVIFSSATKAGKVRIRAGSPRECR
jgi:hypothetical protein